MTAKIIMHNGDKDISFDLDNLKLFLKLHVFMLLFHFFTEGLPKYDIDDADLPNQYDDDSENAPVLNLKVYLNNSIVCLDDLKDCIACNMDLYFIYDRQNVKSIKEELLKKEFKTDSYYEFSTVSYETRFNIVKCNPYFCKYEDLGKIKNFK